MVEAVVCVVDGDVGRRERLLLRCRLRPEIVSVVVVGGGNAEHRSKKDGANRMQAYADLASFNVRSVTP